MKLERMMAITILLLNRKRVQANELAERMEVSLRTIYRDLESLSLAGIPIVSYTGAEGGFEIMDSFRLDRQLLSFAELASLFTALKGLQSTRALNDSGMEALLGKVGALLSQAERDRLSERQQVVVDFTPWRNSETERRKYETLQTATAETKLVRFAYTDGQGGESERSVEPVGLALKGYSWYLHGYCLTREDYRIFKLSRIRDLQMLAEGYRRRGADLAELNRRMKAPVEQAAPRVDLVLRISGEGKVAAIDWFDESEIEKQPNGSLLVRTSLPEGKQLIGFLLQSGTDVLVLEPPRIAEEVRKTALEIAQMYSASQINE
ncbi:transcriptional regulator [Cohnella sp. CIP 111063]|uniref:helix-turn-helix transcriptional regulator n=1 Tax=unclassified Cohnella TaxID=2636738 RepID=UPI000B8BD15D|nr:MULTISPECIES: YafY family protein [unclassified Cohnella]OXS56308.1 transcriptional regulator [Cohnella sp. CIP 111063]PRX67953.1 putative DNA-binding transcriptional regulator YafY [Cohnella sp. SGD-V74]